MATITPSSLRRAAIVQLCSQANKYENLLTIAKCAGLAKREGACMLFLPECFGFMGSSAEETRANAEVVPMNNLNKAHHYSFETELIDETWCQKLTEAVASSSNSTNYGLKQNSSISMIDSHPNASILHGLCAIAKESGLWISGSMHEAGAPNKQQHNEEATSESKSNDSDSSRVYNTHLIINSFGSIVTSYRKIHLFDVSIPSQNIHLFESKTTAPGEKLVVCDSPLGRLGLSTCYDLRFPEMYTELVGKGGADILLVPSAFTKPTGEAHWHTLLRARAIENQCYVIAAAQTGVHNEKRASFGHSIAIDPWGEVLEDAGTNAPSLIFCDIQEEKIHSTRERMPISSHRKNSRFSWQLF